tara:strand:+ start:26 stop:397 length:372 start_codon:yes stop_codon:yes gene_type:complete
MYDLSMVVELKEKCRELFQLGKHSLHISDYPKDTFRISGSLLNENSIHFLNNGTNDIHPNTKELLRDYFNMITENKFERDDYCLVELADELKYITRNENDEILYNPINHYYFNGFKIHKDLKI